MTGTGRQWDWSVAGWQTTSADPKPVTNVSTERQGLAKENATARTCAAEDVKN